MTVKAIKVQDHNVLQAVDHTLAYCHSRLTTPEWSSPRRRESSQGRKTFRPWLGDGEQKDGES